MAINPMALVQLKTAWNRFVQNHPKFPHFIKAACLHGLAEGAVVEITVTSPDGKKICSNLKLTQDDIGSIRLLQEWLKSQ